MKKVKTNTVTDAQGRQRFHGAFTGGFSAGYFNTVGSEEGFKPATFVSSRSNRAQKSERSIRDYMDEDDGLLGGVLTTKKEYDAFAGERDGTTTSQKGNVSGINLNLGDFFQTDPPNTMGRKLLNFMGWKPGQGIGPRIKQVDEDFSSGITRDPFLVPNKSMEEGIVTFAPKEEKDTFVIPPFKNDYYGIGYQKRSIGWKDELEEDEVKAESNRYRVSNLFGAPSSNPLNILKEPEQGKLSGRKRSSKDLFAGSGSYALEDDEDIAYDNPNHHKQAAYDYDVSRGIYDEDEEEGRIQGGRKMSRKEEQLAAMQSKVQSYTQKPTLDQLKQNPQLQQHQQALTGFVKGRGLPSTPPHYPPPPIPADFQPFHTFSCPSAPLKDTVTHSSQTQSRWGKQDIQSVYESRQEAYGSAEEKKQSASIFSMISEEQKQKLFQIAATTNKTSSLTPSASTTELPPTERQEIDTQQPQQRPMLVQNSRFAHLSAILQSRFTTGTSEKKEGKDTDSNGQPVKEAGMFTLEEFKAKQSILSEKMSGTNATVPDSDNTKTAVATRIGKRVTTLWSPASLLCKRCNIRPPEHVAPSHNSSTADNTEKNQLASDLFLQSLQFPSSSSSNGAVNGGAEDIVTNNMNREKEKQQAYEAENVYLHSLHFPTSSSSSEPAASSTAPSSSSASTSQSSAVPVAAATSSNSRPEANENIKKALAVFQSIFLDDDADDDEEESDDEEDAAEVTATEVKKEEDTQAIAVKEEKQQKTENLTTVYVKDEKENASQIPTLETVVVTVDTVTVTGDAKVEDTNTGNLPKFIPRSQRSYMTTSGVITGTGGNKSSDIVSATAASGKISSSVRIGRTVRGGNVLKSDVGKRSFSLLPDSDEDDDSQRKVTIASSMKLAPYDEENKVHVTTTEKAPINISSNANNENDEDEEIKRRLLAFKRRKVSHNPRKAFADNEE